MSAFLKNWPVKGLCGGWLSVPGFCLRCMNTYPYTYSHREGGGGRWTSEKFRWALVHKRGRKYQHDWQYLQFINSIKHQWRRHLGFGVLIDIWSMLESRNPPSLPLPTSYFSHKGRNQGAGIITALTNVCWYTSLVLNKSELLYCTMFPADTRYNKDVLLFLIVLYCLRAHCAAIWSTIMLCKWMGKAK